MKILSILYILIAAVFLGCAASDDSKESSNAKSLKRGKLLYKQCIVCHGDKAQNSYMKEVPPIRNIEFGARAQMMKAYRDGQVGDGIYGMADLKGEVMLKLSDADMRDIDIYIESLKEQDEKNSN